MLAHRKPRRARVALVSGACFPVETRTYSRTHPMSPGVSVILPTQSQSRSDAELETDDSHRLRQRARTANVQNHCLAHAQQDMSEKCQPARPFDPATPSTQPSLDLSLRSRHVHTAASAVLALLCYAYTGR